MIRGRYWVMLWLLLFLGVATIVVVRQRAGLDTARRVAALRAERAALEAQGADLERRIRDGSSRKVLVPRAESLGLHSPSDSEFVQFRVEDPSRSGGRQD